MIGSFTPRNLSGEKFTNGMSVWPKKCDFIRLRGTKEGQECASLGPLEISSMSSGERQRNFERAREVQEVLERRGRTGAHERNNRGTEDVQQRYKR